MASNRLAWREDMTAAQMERISKRLIIHTEGILLDQQETLKDLIKDKAPKGETGDLRDGVFVEVLQYKNGPVLRGGVRGVPYAVFIEFGARGKPPNPFVRASLAEMGGRIARRRKGRR